MAPPTTEADSFDSSAAALQCDESKCVSRGNSHLFENSFTCYGDADGAFYPMMCADGYLPKIVETEPSAVDETGSAELLYFTCCPPSLQDNESNATIAESTTNQAAHRQCSDPVALPDYDKQDNMRQDFVLSACDNNSAGNRRFPRIMKPSGGLYPDFDTVWYNTVDKVDSMQCCENALHVDPSTQNNYLEDAECVPYDSEESYSAGAVLNTYAREDPIHCHFPEVSFVHPKPIGDAMVTHRYQCCKTGPSMKSLIRDAPFVRGEAIKLSFLAVACLASAVVVVGLLLPLILQLSNGSYYKIRSRRQHRRTSSRIGGGSAHRRRSQSLRSDNETSPQHQPQNQNHQQQQQQRRHTHTHQQQRRRQSQSIKSTSACQPRRYSTYNLYLVYLTLADLVLLYSGLDIHVRMVLYGEAVTSFPFWEVCYSCINANIWVNAIICYETLLFLKSFRQEQRLDPPSLKRVNLQCGTAYALSSAAYVFTHYFYGTDRFVYIALFVAPPVGYVVYVAVVVWWCGYIRPLQPLALGRELALYFLRIVWIFLGIWVPFSVLHFYGMASSGNATWAILLGDLVAPIQAIASTVMILTKSDVRNYILDLLTLSYLFGDKKSECSGCCCFFRRHDDEQGDRDRSSLFASFVSTSFVLEGGSTTVPISTGNGGNNSSTFSPSSGTTAIPKHSLTILDDHDSSHPLPAISSMRETMDDEHGSCNYSDDDDDDCGDIKIELAGGDAVEIFDSDIDEDDSDIDTADIESNLDGDKDSDGDPEIAC